MHNVFFSEGNKAFVCIQDQVKRIGWRSLYFIELFWILEGYVSVALVGIYVLYLVVTFRLEGDEEEEQLVISE